MGKHLIPVFLVFLMLSAPASGSMSTVLTGSQFSDEWGQVYDCTDASPAGACDNASSVVVGYNNYRDGWSAVTYDLILDEEVECVENEIKIRLDKQTNGPNSGIQNGVSQSGWVGGSTLNVDNASDAAKDDNSRLVVSAWDWDQGNGAWNRIDANNKIQFNTGNYGTISTRNDGSGWFTDEISIVKTGTVNLTGRTGTFLVEDSDDETKSHLRIRVLNHPQQDWPSYRTDHLRTEIRSVKVLYDDETVPPNNPTGGWNVSSIGTYPDFPVNQWTTTRVFAFEKDVGANDSCEYDRLEYVILPIGTSPSTGTTVGSTTSSTTISSVWAPYTSNQYRLWYRAVDGNGNPAAWTYDSNFAIKIDTTKPTAGTTVLNYPSTGWFSDSVPPSVSWSGWSDSHSSISYYHVLLNNNEVANLSNTASSYTVSQTNTLVCSGQNSLKLRALDGALPVPNSQTTTLMTNFDNCDPTPAEVVLPANGWYTSNNPSIQFSQASEPSTQSGVVSCIFAKNNVSVATIPTSACTSGGTVTLQLLDGVVQGHIRTCDLAGNCANSSQKLLRVDTVSPTLQASVVRSPTQDAWSQNNDLNLTLSFTDLNSQSSVQVSEMANVYAGVFPSTSVPSLSQVQNGGYSTSCATNSCGLDIAQTLTDGNHSVWYVAKDKAGNVLGPSKLSGHFLVDTVGPSSTTPYFAANITNQTSMNLLWLASQDSNSGLAGYVLNVSRASTGTVTTYNLGQTTSQNITGLSDGNYSACLTPVDEADNYGQTSCTTTSLWVDTTAPTLQAWSDVDGWTTSTRVNITWEASDSSETTQVRYKLDSNGFSQALPENFTASLSGLSVGLHHVIVRANDSAGNAQEVLVTFGVDITGPTISASHDLGPLWTNQTQHTISWNVSDSHSGVENISIYQSGSLIATNLSPNGSWTFNLTAGLHNLSLFAIDEVGHESWWSTNARVDTATPSVSCLVSPAGWSNTLPMFYLNISANGSLSNIAHVATYDGVLFNAPTSGWHNLPASLDGIHVVAVTVSNQGGNSEACSVNVYYDTTPPVFTAPPQLPAVTSASTLNLSLSAQDVHAGVAEVLWELDNITLQASSSTTASLDISAFSEGTKNLRITLTDHAGNQRDWTSTFILDRTAPSIDTFALANTLNNGWLNQSAATINLEASDNLDNNVETALSVNGVATEYTGSSASIELPEGESSIAFSVTDHAGLTTTQEFNISVDTTVPRCVLTSEIGSTTWSNQVQRDISIISEGGFSGHDVEFFLNNMRHDDQQRPFAVVLQNGANNMDARVSSIAGLSSTCSLVQLLDNDEDRAEIEVASSLGKYGDGLVIMNFSASTNGLSNGSLKLLINGEAMFNASYNGDYSNSRTFELPTGSHTVSIQTEDEAGNTFSSDETHVSVIMDFEPPEVMCYYEDVKGDRTVLSRDSSILTVVEVVVSSMARNKIVCDATDENPLLFENGLGSAVISMSVGGSVGPLEGGSATYLLPEGNRVPSSEVTTMEVMFEDMWGNSILRSYHVLFIDSARMVDLSCTTDEDSGIKWLDEERTCTVRFPKFEPNDGPKLLMEVDYAFDELGFSSQFWVNGKSIQLPRPLVFSNQVESDVMDLYSILDSAGHEEFITALNVQFSINSTAGKPLSESISVRFEPCENSDKFVPNYTTKTCEPAAYIGPEFEHVEDELGALLVSGTTNVTLSHITPFNEHGIKSTCTFNGISKDIPAADANFTLRVEADQTEIRIQCVDAFGYPSQEIIQLSWQPPKGSDGLFGGLPTTVLVGAGLAVLAVLGLLGAWVVIRRPRKTDRLGEAGPHVQDSDDEVIPAPSTAPVQASAEASPPEVMGQLALDTVSSIPLAHDAAPATSLNPAMSAPPDGANPNSEGASVEDLSHAGQGRPQLPEE